MYKNIEELLNANDPPEDDIYEVLTLKVSNYFYKKYNNNILIKLYLINDIFIKLDTITN